MGYYKNLGPRGEARRYNAAARRAAKLNGGDGSRLIHLETVSETERYTMAQDADCLTEYNKAVEGWYTSVAAELKGIVGSRSTRIAKELKPKAYTDKYGLINRIGFSFPRHGIYIHKGAGRGKGGYTGSKWTKRKMVNGIEINTGIVRHTSPESINGLQGTGNRPAFKWFDPVVRRRLPELADIVTRYFDTMILDATRIFIEKQ